MGNPNKALDELAKLYLGVAPEIDSGSRVAILSETRFLTGGCGYGQGSNDEGKACVPSRFAPCDAGTIGGGGGNDVRRNVVGSFHGGHGGHLGGCRRKYAMVTRCWYGRWRMTRRASRRSGRIGSELSCCGLG